MVTKQQTEALRSDIHDLTEAVKDLVVRSNEEKRVNKRIRYIVWGLVVMFVMGLGLITFLVLTNSRLTQYAQCQANYNDINNQRTRALTEASARERAAERARVRAQDDVFLDESLLRARRTPAEIAKVRKLFLDYREKAFALRAEQEVADKSREQNPVPPPPSQLCDYSWPTLFN